MHIIGNTNHKRLSSTLTKQEGIPISTLEDALFNWFETPERTALRINVEGLMLAPSTVKRDRYSAALFEIESASELVTEKCSTSILFALSSKPTCCKSASKSESRRSSEATEPAKLATSGELSAVRLTFLLPIEYRNRTHRWQLDLIICWKEHVAGKMAHFSVRNIKAVYMTVKCIHYRYFAQMCTDHVTSKPQQKIKTMAIKDETEINLYNSLDMLGSLASTSTSSAVDRNPRVRREVDTTRLPKQGGVDLRDTAHSQ